MRHLIGLGLALLLAAAVFFAATWGYLRLLRIPVVNGAAATLPAGGGSLLHDKNVLLAFAALAGTALFAGICVAAPRISPLAAGLPGLLLLAYTVLYLFNVHRAVHYIPSRWRRPVRPDTPWTPAESSSLLSDWTETAPISPTGSAAVHRPAALVA